MKKTKFTNLLLISLSGLLWFSISCRSSDTDNKLLNNDLVTIHVNLAQDDYEDVDSKNIQASINNNLNLDNNFVQRKEIPFGNDFDLVAELKPEAISLKRNVASVSHIAAAVAITRAIKFRIVVYDASGQYNSSYIYTISNGGVVTADGGPMILNGGQSYTFIAYSYNSTNAPNENLVGTNLSTASLAISNVDFMYYKTTMTPSGDSGAQNNLNVVLKHTFSTITLGVISTNTHYNITNVTNAAIGKHYPNASVNLNNGAVTSSGIATTKTAIFPANPNSSAVFSTTPIVVNNSFNVNDGTFTIGSLTVGPLTQSNVTFSGLTIQPGVRYILSLQLFPKDGYFTDYDNNNILTARINGKTWMRYNLGATASNPDVAPNNATLFGDYYQWGSLYPSGAPNTSPWNTSTYPANNSWFNGTEPYPLKGYNDPCPSGYRIPTDTEFQNLIASTTQSNSGNWDSESATNYSSLKIFTSNRDANVKLSFPATGYRNRNGLGPLQSRGTGGFYWVSTSPRGSGTSRVYNNIQMYKNSLDFESDANAPFYGENLRCVRETSL
ncbi:hypothetical protein CMU25_17280 [Elizabethkingia anophelis]|nr:hypothetical protein [Elizabethkingia anophelis]MDV3842075.1 hypothetical protein [Elizabethkingia anophelis]